MVGLSKGQRTAQRILDVAEVLFAAKGYENTSLREIADEVGIQEPGLYRHFKNKDLIYQSVLERALNPIKALLEDKLNSELTKESLRQLPAEVFDLFAAHPPVAFLFQRAVMESPEQRNAMQDWLIELLGQSRELLELIPDKGLDSQGMVLRVMALLNLCIGYFTAQGVMNILIDEETTSPELLEKQKALLTELMESWVV